MTIDSRFDPHRNSLNFLRLVFALAVIVSHEWPLGGYGPEPVLAGITLGEWAVAGFFAVSGFLIANSRLRTPFFNFCARRVLRIYPGFITCLFVIVLVFAPLSVLIGPGSIQWSSAASYIGSNLFLKIEQNGIDHTLTNVPYGNAWDGSLWTLFYEFACYLAIGVLLGAAVRFQRHLVVLGFVACAVGDTILVHYVGVSNTTLQNFLWLGAVFFAGAVLAVYADRIPLDWRIAVGAMIVLPIATEQGLLSLVGALPAAYLCLWLGVVLPFSGIGRRNDISYGVYIYAFPVQQILVMLHVNKLPVAAGVVLSAAVTIPLAVLSWVAIERPALALKGRLGRRQRGQVFDSSQPRHQSLSHELGAARLPGSLKPGQTDVEP